MSAKSPKGAGGGEGSLVDLDGRLVDEGASGVVKQDLDREEGFGGGSGVGRDVEGEERADLGECGEGRCSCA